MSSYIHTRLGSSRLIREGGSDNLGPRHVFQLEMDEVLSVDLHQSRLIRQFCCLGLPVRWCDYGLYVLFDHFDDDFAGRKRTANVNAFEDDAFILFYFVFRT